jgi:quinolinate synthase
MKRNTFEKIYLCLEYEMPEILMDEELRSAALLSIKKGRRSAGKQGCNELIFPK